MNKVFADVTNVNSSVNFYKMKHDAWAGIHAPAEQPKKVTRHNPYAVRVLPDNIPSAAEIFSQILMEAAEELQQDQIQKVTVQFKCHRGEFSSKLHVDVGVYVVVQGDRGIDVGVVVAASYVPPSGAPIGSLIGCASQKEVNYWATDLKVAEHEALQISQQQVSHLKLDMTIRQAEYQYDKKKLTLYYTAHDRVEYEVLTKELFRQFGCRIWLVKVESATTS